MITHNKSCCDSSIKPQSHQADAYTENSYTNQILVESNYLLSDEVDEKGNLFVLTSGDHLEFGVIEENTSLTPAPFQLSEGVITNPKTNDGYGLVHIEARHGDQIRKKGYKTVIDFIEDIAKNYEVIREGNLRNGNKTYLIQLAKKRYNYTLIVELSEDGTYWNINTAGIFNKTYGAKRYVVYSRHTTAKQPAEIVEVSQSEEQSGTTSQTSMDTTTQQIFEYYSGKGNEDNLDQQE